MDQTLTDTIQEAIATLDSALAIKALSIIKKDAQSNVDQEDLDQLQFVRMNSLTERQVLDLLRKSLLVAYTIPEYDLFERIVSYLEQLDSAAAEIAFLQSLVQTLPKNQNKLGAATVAEWIADYANSPSEQGQKNNYTETQYLTNSPKVRALSGTERNVLLNLLKLYDYCQNTVSRWNTFTTPRSEQEAFKDFDLYRFIPGLEDDLDQAPQAVRSTVPSQPTGVMNAPTLKTLARPQPVKPLSPPLSTDGVQVKHIIDRPEPRLPKGLALDQTTNIKVDELGKRVQEERSKTQTDIAQKLEELRKRKKV